MTNIAEQNYGDKLEPQQSVDVEFLERYPEVMEEDMQHVADVLLAMRRQPIVNAFVEKTGLNRHEETNRIMFSRNSSIECRDINILQNALRMGGVREEVFRPSIDRLRTQFAGQFYYHLKMLDAEGSDNKVNEILELMSEMNECGRYPVRIYQDRVMIDGLVESADDFKEMRMVFNFMERNKYEDSDGNERMLHEPDEEMFEAWLEKCKKAKHFKRVNERCVRHGVDIEMPVIEWYCKCEDADDYAYFFKKGIHTGDGFKPVLNHFLNWFRAIETYKQLDEFIECLIKFDVEPDARLFGMMKHHDGLRGTGGFGVNEFRERFEEHYSAPESSKRVSSRGMSTVHHLVMNGLTEERV